jgi:hypothetical protein
MRMVDDFISYRRSASGGRTARLQATGPIWYRWWAPIFVSLLLACVIAVLLIQQIASTESTAQAVPSVVAGEQTQGERDEGCPSGRCQGTVAPPEPQKPAADMIVPAPEPQKSGPEMVAPAPEPQKSSPEMIAPSPEPPKAARKAHGSGLPQLVLPADVAKRVGHRIWLNESGGNRDAITSWNANEEFASLGIGHFIWFPAGKTAPFEESFPLLLEFLRAQKVPLPSWLDETPIPPCPWTSRADFTKNFNSRKMRELRQFLLDTIPEQTQFLIVRAQGAIDKILEATPESAERQHIITQFSRIAHASKDLYPLIDYINFKGEGTNPAETALDEETRVRQGWGLKQVLLRMTGTTSDPAAVLGEFANAAQFVLRQRVRNIPANRIWEAGWLRRVESYRRPIADLKLEPKRARKQLLRKRG